MLREPPESWREEEDLAEQDPEPQEPERGADGTEYEPPLERVP